MLKEGCVTECPACPHREWTREQSEAQKNAWLLKNLEPWKDVLHPVQSPQNRWGYRGKALLRAQWSTAALKWEFGVMDRDRNLIPIPRCPVHSAEILEIFAALTEALQPHPELPLAFVSIVGRQCTLVLKGARQPSDIRRINGGAIPHIDGLWLNFNPSAGERVFSHRKDDWLLVWGEESSQLSLLGNPYRHGPTSFVQLIPELYEKALTEAFEFFSPLSAEQSVVDLYSGIGISLALWKKSGAKTIGVELHGESQRYANLNSASGLCLRGKTEDRLAHLMDWQNALLYLNPPRSGLSNEVRHWIVESLKPRKIAYLSCHAATLARDLDFLTRNTSLRIQKLRPFDFFPQTKQVETLALLG